MGALLADTQRQGRLDEELKRLEPSVACEDGTGRDTSARGEDGAAPAPNLVPSSKNDQPDHEMQDDAFRG